MVPFGFHSERRTVYFRCYRFLAVVDIAATTRLTPVWASNLIHSDYYGVLASEFDVLTDYSHL